VTLFPNGNLPPDEDWALALAREAVIRALTESHDQSDVTEGVVVTSSDELRDLSKSGLPARRKTPDGSGRVREWKWCPDTCAPAKSQRIGAVYDLSTVFPRI
jgi:hypothetical protein